MTRSLFRSVITASVLHLSIMKKYFRSLKSSTTAANTRARGSDWQYASGWPSFITVTSGLNLPLAEDPYFHSGCPSNTGIDPYSLQRRIKSTVQGGDLNGISKTESR